MPPSLPGEAGLMAGASLSAKNVAASLWRAEFSPKFPLADSPARQGHAPTACLLVAEAKKTV